MVAASRAVAEYRTSGGFNPALVRFRRTVGRAAAKTTLVPNRPTLFTNATSDRRCSGVDKRHILEIEYQKPRRCSHAFENAQYARSSSKEKRH